MPDKMVLRSVAKRLREVLDDSREEPDPIVLSLEESESLVELIDNYLEE